MKEQVYVDERSAGEFAKYHARTRGGPPDIVYEFVRLITSAIYVPLDRVSAIDPQNVPVEGGVIFVPNHFSFIDHFFTGFHLRRKIQFMAKSQIFKPPLDFVFSHGGVFPVMRGKHDEETFVTAQAILDRGGVVQMYAEGGRSRTYHPGEAKRGPGLMALRSGAPVVPIAIYGSQFMRDVKRRGFPKVTVRYGRPVRFESIPDPTVEQQADASRQIFDRVKSMFAELEGDAKRKAPPGSHE